jgi:poly(glycerol-phosphate) alpha-glucosyltransferase
VTLEALVEHREDVDATVFLTVTQRAEAEAVYGRQDNFYVVPHSAPDASPEPGVERDPNLVIMMARLDPQKQLDHALQAWQRVQRALPDARLEIYGRGPLQAQLSDQIKQLRLTGSVTLAGFTTDPHSVYRRAGLCIMTSKFEGAPLTLLESFALSCPVVSYDLRYGPADIIEDGVNGFLVPYGDRKAMAETIVRCLDDPELLRRLSAGTAQSAKQFTQEAFVARWSAIYNTLDAKGWAEQN